MSLSARQRQPPELYGILGDDPYKQLFRPNSAIGRYYLSFHSPAGGGVVGSDPTGEVSSYHSPTPAAGPSRSEYSQSKRSPRTQPDKTSHEDSRPSQVSADPTGQSWFNPEAEVRKPKRPSRSNKTRKALRASPAPQVPKQQQAAPPVMYSYGSSAPPRKQPLTGLLIKEPAQSFERAKGPPRKSAMKTPTKQPSPPLKVTNLSIAPPPIWISAPSPSSAGPHYGPFIGASSVAFASSSYYSSSAPRWATQGRLPYEDDSPIEPSGPRQILFVVNKDPDSGSEKSPVLDKEPYVLNTRKHELSDALSVPPVPPLPPQFQPSPPPNYPPLAGHHRRVTSDLDVPSNSRSGSDRDRKSGRSRNHYHHLSRVSSSSSGDEASSSSGSSTPRRRDGVIFPASPVTDLPIGSPLTGFLTREGEQPFAEMIDSARRPAMKTPDQQALLLPAIDRSLPVTSSYPVQTPSSPSTVTNLSIKPPPSIASGWAPRWSRAETATSALNSEFGTSTSTSFSNFRSSAAFSSSSYYSHSAPRFSALDRITSEDEYPIEPPTRVPRQDLSITNEDWLSPRARYDSDSGATASSLEVEPTPGERICPLPLTLEELFKGGMHTYRIMTLLLSGEPKVEKICINIEPGWEAGTRIISRNSGDEVAPGVFQTMVFVVEQIHHERFTRRKGGEIMYNQNINLVDAVKDNGRREARKVIGLDGKVIEFYPPKGVINHGQETLIKGEGMYTRSKNKVVERGDLIIR
ncbi:hypothetical protein FRC00_014273 [Tulasnella sp. 408]|nr:hypothetical protein FRC00_014273 [Tulasnella sp. 408]